MEEKLKEAMTLQATGRSVKEATHVPWDIVCFGVLMILSGLGDLSIIMAYPEYSLPFFGTKPEGIFGLVIKGIQPPIHFIAGFGAIYRKKWAYPFFMIYSIYGLANAVTNRILLPPPHNIRTIFILGTLVVMGYLYFRRKAFTEESAIKDRSAGRNACR